MFDLGVKRYVFLKKMLFWQRISYLSLDQVDYFNNLSQQSLPQLVQE
jgi:hypothetical protein